MSRPASEICSKGLWRLLTDTGIERAEAVRLIGLNPKLRGELEHILPILEAKAAPLTPEVLAERLARQWVTFSVPDRSAAEWAAMVAPYLDALAPLSADMIDDAFIRWNRSELYPDQPGRHAFFPKPAEIYALAERSRLELAGAAFRAREAAKRIDQKAVAAPTVVDRARNRQALIDAGMMTEDGRVILPEVKGVPPASRPTGETPHQMAERLRAAAEDDPAPADETPEEFY